MGKQRRQKGPKIQFHQNNEKKRFHTKPKMVWLVQKSFWHISCQARTDEGGNIKQIGLSALGHCLGSKTLNMLLVFSGPTIFLLSACKLYNMCPPPSGGSRWSACPRLIFGWKFHEICASQTSPDKCHFC